jgi:hypothetical protein
MEVILKPLEKVLLNVIAKRLTVFPLPLSAEEKVSVSPCGSVANNKIVHVCGQLI